MGRKQDIHALLPDNNTRQISEQDLRDSFDLTFEEISDSVQLEAEERSEADSQLNSKIESKINIANEFTGNHAAWLNNEYKTGDVVYYEGHIFKALHNNDGIIPQIGGNTYWQDLGEGSKSRQNPVDWNAIEGDNQILNKPEEFNPSAHFHKINEVYGLQNELDSINTAIENEATTRQNSDSTLDSKILAEAIRNTNQDSIISQLQNAISVLQNWKSTLTDADSDNLVSTLTELLATVQNVPEGTDIFALINSKVNISDVINNLISLETNKPLSAYQGKILNDLINAVQGQLNSLFIPSTLNDLSDVDTGIGKITPVDSDDILLRDSSGSIWKKLSWLNLKASIKGFLDGIYKPLNWFPTWTEVTGKPTTFTPSTHTHPISEVDNLASAMANKADLVGGIVPSSQLPSFMDDVLEYASLLGFPAIGESGKIYVAIDTNKSYRWSGSLYVHLDDGVALGETSGTAYRGDRGKAAYDHSQSTGNPHGTTKSDVGLGNVPNTDATNPANISQNVNYRFVSDSEKNTWNAKANADGTNATGNWPIGISGNAATATTATNSNKLGGYTSGQFVPKYTTTLDLSGLDTGKWYPILINISVPRTLRMRIENGLNSNVPSWATHPGGFSLVLDWESNGSGWGTIEIQRKIHSYKERFSSASICGGIGQLGNSSNEWVFLRGGGIYYFEADSFISTPTIVTTSYSYGGESIAPITSVSNDIWSAATGQGSSFANLFIGGQQVLHAGNYFNYYPPSLAGYTDVTTSNWSDTYNTNDGLLKILNVYNVYTSTTGMNSNYGTVLHIGGQVGHDKTQLIFNGENGSIQYRKSWFNNSAWTGLRTILDSNNYTSYNSFGTLYTGNWFRSTGASGWYNESYGGGIYMQDGNWVRVYGGKSFLCQNIIRGVDIQDDYGQSLQLGTKTISTGTTIDNTYHNCVVYISASVTITIPTGLRADFHCVFEVIGTYTANISFSSGVTFEAPFGQYLKNNNAAILKFRGTNLGRLTGNTATS